MEYSGGGKAPRRALRVSDALNQHLAERQEEVAEMERQLEAQLPDGMPEGRTIVLPADPTLAGHIISTFSCPIGASICSSQVQPGSPAMNPHDDTFRAFRHTEGKGFHAVEAPPQTIEVS
jgi:hypothetical protein